MRLDLLQLRVQLVTLPCQLHCLNLHHWQKPWDELQGQCLMPQSPKTEACRLQSKRRTVHNNKRGCGLCFDELSKPVSHNHPAECRELLPIHLLQAEDTRLHLLETVLTNDIQFECRVLTNGFSAANTALRPAQQATQDTTDSNTKLALLANMKVSMPPTCTECNACSSFW